MEEANELDLKELFKIIWEKKFFIVIFTFIVTVLSIIYALNIKPIYEVKSIVKIGNINGVQLEESNLLAKKLNLIFQVGRAQNRIEDDKGIVSNVGIVKNLNKLLEISTQAYSNEFAIKKNQEVIEFLKKEYKYKIDEYIFNTNLQIEKLKKDLNKAQVFEKENIRKQIERVKKIEVPKVEKSIEILKTQTLVNIDKEITFLKDIELKTIDNKLNFNSKKILEYEKNVKKISDDSLKNDAKHLITATQTLNNQNLILNLQTQIEDLNIKKSNLIDVKLKSLIDKKKNLLEITLIELENQKKELLENKLIKLIYQMDILQEEKIDNLKNQIMIVQNKLTKNHMSNSYILGEMIINEFPIKPKKKLIVIISFVTAFILSIFLVFFIQFIKTFKEEKN